MRTHNNVAIVLLAMVGLIALAQRAQGEFIASGYQSGSVGTFEPFKGLDMKVAFDVAPDDGPTPEDRPWLFELNGLTSVDEGSSWIADASNPNWNAGVAILTNGEWDFLYMRFHLNIATPNEAEIGLAEFHLFHGVEGTYPDAFPDEPERIDLAGYDLTEIHLTFEQLIYGESSSPFGTVYGYAYTIRLDFYGTPIPAPSALALVGFLAVTKRRRRST